jgi:hypothetical protein
MLCAKSKVKPVQVVRRSASILAAFVLGVTVALAVVFTTGGIYEYRLGGPGDTVQLVNDEHWELVSGMTLPSSAYYLRRPRLRLP